MKENEKVISFGSPRLLVAHRFVPVTDETRENILLLARLNETPFICSIMATAIKHWLYQKGNVEIWAYERNPVFSQYRNVFESLNVKVFKGIDDVCDAIRATKADIDANKKTNKLVVLIGMDRIGGDFTFFSGAARQKSSVMEIRERMVQQASPKTEEEMIKTKYHNKLIVQTEGVTDEAEKRAIIERLKKELNAELAGITQKGGALKKDDSPKDVEAEASGAYDAGADFSFVVKQGSRFGIHFFLHLSDLSEVKEIGLNLNLFRHRLAFQMSAEASRDYYGSKVASLLPEHVCQYSNTVDSFSFRPYLHEGIEWDGWTLDENKNVIDPMTLET